MKDLRVWLIAATLVTLGCALFIYKWQYLQFPLHPEQRSALWMVEARVALTPKSGVPVQVQMQLPGPFSSYALLSEDFVSRKFGLTTETYDDFRQANWAIRRANDEQVLYYRAVLHEQPTAKGADSSSRPPFPEVPEYEEPYRSAVMTLLDEVRSRSADITTFTSELLVRMNEPNGDENVNILRRGHDDRADWVRQLVRVLAGARIPARPVSGLKLSEGLTTAELECYLQVFNGRRWVIFDPYTGRPGLPDNFLVWHVGEEPIIRTRGISDAEVKFSVAKTYREMIAVAQQEALITNPGLARFSLLSLPVQTQNIYRILLTVPIGALLVVFLRNLIGIKTFGTFMPILIALAFRETQLLWGLVMFVLLVGVGLAIRFYLEQLKLLLVPRLSAVLIIVVLLMAAFSILSHRLGLERGLSVALFPMVIMAMTIERMSIVWEEHGPNEAIRQGAGSLMVAVAGYLVMTNVYVAHLVFVFPELLLLILGITLVMGRYTGYRLTELRRFRALVKEDGTD
ncbi:MAG: UUP1 family membrane protein [Pseudomonadota bacterium]|nr:UUP1 family membrane protein [Pseudomonadota bacterium]